MEEQIAAYYNLLLAYINKRVNNPMDAQDLTQEVFYKLSKSDLKEVQNLQSWVFTVAKNTLIDYYRSKRTELRHLEESFLEEAQSENRSVEELSQCILPFIELLPHPYAELLMKTEIEGIPQKQIAEELNLNYVTLRSKVQRGRLKLRDLFKACCAIDLGCKGSILDYQKKTNCC